MNKVKDLANSILIVLPIIFIEWREFDKLSKYVIMWTILYLFFSQAFHRYNQFSPIPPLYARFMAASTQCAYLFAAIDVRFFHISDKVDMLSRFTAAAIYSFFIIFEIGLINILSTPVNIYSKGNSAAHLDSILSLLYLSNSIILISGQVALNSRISVLLVLPGALFCLLWSVELHRKKPWETQL